MTDEGRERAVGGAEANFARRDHASEGSKAREETLEEPLRSRMKPCRAAQGCAAPGEKIAGFLDEARLRRMPGAKYHEVGSARGLECAAQPQGLRCGFDEATPSMVGDHAEAVPLRPRDRDVAEKPFYVGRDERGEGAHQGLRGIDSAPVGSGALLLAKDDGRQQGRSH